MVDLDEFQRLTAEINYRPLMFNKAGLDQIINSPRFHSIGFFFVSTKTRGVLSPAIVTVRYVLYDKDNTPLSIDGKVVKNINTLKLKETGYDKNKGLTNTSIRFQKRELKDIAEKLSKPYSYCIIGLERFSKQDYTFFYEIVDTWKSSGGGPGQGVGKGPS